MCKSGREFMIGERHKDTFARYRGEMEIEGSKITVYISSVVIWDNFRR